MSEDIAAPSASGGQDIDTTLHYCVIRMSCDICFRSNVEGIGDVDVVAFRYSSGGAMPNGKNAKKVIDEDVRSRRQLNG